MSVSFKNSAETKTKPISTAALPDIVFILLFFFMVTTVMRDVDPLVEIDLPETENYSLIERRSLVDHIRVGKRVDRPELGTAIQLNDALASVSAISEWKEECNSPRQEVDLPKVITSLMVDGQTEMSQVTAIKQELRKGNHLKILYSSESISVD